jgi:hypothetical protein
VSFVWIAIEVNAKMYNGQANGCQSNVNLNIFAMCKKQCMKVEQRLAIWAIVCVLKILTVPGLFGELYFFLFLFFSICKSILGIDHI